MAYRKFEADGVHRVVVMIHELFLCWLRCFESCVLSILLIWIKIQDFTNNKVADRFINMDLQIFDRLVLKSEAIFELELIFSATRGR